MIRVMMCGVALFAAGCSVESSATGLQRLQEIEPLLPQNTYVTAAIYNAAQDVLCVGTTQPAGLRDGPAMIIHRGNSIMVYTEQAVANGAADAHESACDPDQHQKLVETDFN